MLVTCLCFVTVTQLEQFVFSFFGSKIQSEVKKFKIISIKVTCYWLLIVPFKSLEIGSEAYNLKWYNRSPRFQKLIALIIARSQDAKISITAGKFYYVDLESYGKVLQSSFGYFTIINSVYRENGPWISSRKNIISLSVVNH